LIEKLSKQKDEHDKSMQEANLELEKIKKQIEEVKAQSNVVEWEKAQKIEDLKKTMAANKILSNDKVKQIIKDYRKNLVEQIRERMVNLSKLYYLKNQVE